MIKERIHNLHLQVSRIYKIQVWKPQTKGPCWRLSLTEITQKIEEPEDGNKVNEKGQTIECCELHIETCHSSKWTILYQF